MSENPSHKLELMSQPAGALEVMRDLAERVIILRVERARTRERAIQEIAKEHGLGTWLKRLIYREPVADSASNMAKLTIALQSELSASDRRRANDRAVLKAIYGAVA